MHKPLRRVCFTIALLLLSAFASAAPALCVRLDVPGATAEQIEKEVTNLVEKRLIQLFALDRIDSVTNYGQARVLMVYKQESDDSDIATAGGALGDLAPTLRLRVAKITIVPCTPDVAALKTLDQAGPARPQ
jgi:multidrug efflux pump subunit AcrB